MSKERCNCGKHLVNLDTAPYSVGMKLCCSRICYTEALDELRARDYEPQGVTGGSNVGR